MAESSSILVKADKPVIVRVKRKAFQSRLDAFWLEINERPLKRPLIDFGKLSISDSSSSTAVEDVKKKKVLVRHLETVTTSEETFDVLRSLVPSSSDAPEVKEKNSGRVVRTVNKQNELLIKAKQSQEVLARNARFEQIWRSRKGKNEAVEEETVYEMCRLYDVVRVDEMESKLPDKGMDLEECKMMAQYLPLLREVLPTAAEEIECDIHGSMSKQATSDGYVYDFYAVEESTIMESDFYADQFPLVQVDDDSDYYDGPDDSEYESDDSNAEKNPLNDYPDEETSEIEDEEVTSQSSEEKSEAESGTSESQSEDHKNAREEFYEYQDSGPHYFSDNGEQFFVDEMYSEGDEYVYGNDFEDDEELR